MISRFMVKRHGQTLWVDPHEMTQLELVKEYERAERRQRAGIFDPKDLVLKNELVRRSTQAPEVGLC